MADRWRKASYSNSFSNCVEIAGVPGGAAVRDSKDQAGPVLRYSAAAWDRFLTRVKDGAFDV